MPADPVSTEITAELITDAITSVIGGIRHAVGRAQRDSADARASDLLNRGAEALATRINLAIAARGLLPSYAHAPLRHFLNSDEMASIARQLCAAAFAGQAHQYSTAIKNELTMLLVLEIQLHEPTAQELATLIIENLSQEFESAKHNLHGRGTFEDKAWRELFLTHLSSLDRVIECLAGKRSADLTEIRRFSQSLREQVRQRHRLITPPNVSGVRRVPISRIYVTPRLHFVAAPRPQSRINRGEYEDYPVKSTIEEFTRGIHRTVVLGSPGTGKTTLITKLCYELAGQATDIQIAGHHPIPIPVILRDFVAARKDNNISIADYISSYIHSRLQLEAPVDGINYLLLTGSVAVLFDGLDELLDSGFRRAIVADVESFCSRYSATPVLVTSRRVGYSEAPLDESVFDTWVLADFDLPQVESYVKTWFALTTESTSDEQHRTVEAFLRESSHIRDLRSNPLILALLCNLYRGEGYLPRYRTDVYERCATMLFERWDRSRGIGVPMSFEVNLSAALTAIAYWIYSNEEMRQGVTEEALVDQATGYLHKRQFQQLEYARAAARDFVEYCRGRAWVLTDTGSTGSGEPLYQFTHRTFLEYFAAVYLVRVNVTPQRLWTALQGHIAKGEWEVAASIAVQLIHRNVQDGADLFLGRLLKYAEKSGAGRRYHLLGFAVQCLSFIVPSPDVVIAITDFLFVRQTVSVLRSGDLSIGGSGIPLIRRALKESADENRDPIISSLEHTVYLQKTEAPYSEARAYPFVTALTLLRFGTAEHGRIGQWSATVRQLGYADSVDILDIHLRTIDKVHREEERGLITVAELFEETLAIWRRFLTESAI